MKHMFMIVNFLFLSSQAIAAPIVFDFPRLQGISETVGGVRYEYACAYSYCSSGGIALAQDLASDTVVFAAGPDLMFDAVRVRLSAGHNALKYSVDRNLTQAEVMADFGTFIEIPVGLEAASFENVGFLGLRDGKIIAAERIDSAQAPFGPNGYTFSSEFRRINTLAIVALSPGSFESSYLPSVFDYFAGGQPDFFCPDFICSGVYVAGLELEGYSASVPLPATGLLAGCGILSLLAIRSSRRRVFESDLGRRNG